MTHPSHPTPHPSQITTRFAPSPTGLLHLGNVRTALLNWIYAKKHGGRFLLRFEDTDRDRSEQQYIDAIKDDLAWMGLAWDGDVLFQSEHAGNHSQALKKLADQGLAYRCFCSETQLNLDRKLATSRGLPPRYNGRCRDLNAAESARRAESEPFVWRLKVHADDGDVIVPDLLHGDTTFALRDLDDPVVVRSDGSFTFLLPNAVDDAIDGITHAVRGDDHLTNSAYQVWMLQKLGYAPPHYLHHGLLLGENGAKLSKRSGSHSVAELRDDGLLPGALFQAMARLGHPNMPDEAHSVAALTEYFNAEHVSTSSVRWSDDEMWRWHTRLLHELDVETLASMIQPYLPDVSAQRLTAFASLIGRNIERAADVAHYQRLLDVHAPLDADALAVVRKAGGDFYQAALTAWNDATDVTDANESDWKGWAATVKTATGSKGRGLFMPLRVALSGAQHGPEMSAVVAFLDEYGEKDAVAIRLSDAKRLAGS